MVTVLKRGTTKRQIALVMKKIVESVKTRGFNARLYCGKLKLKNDPFLIQKGLRDEWE